MFIATCNRCGRPTDYTTYSFKITESNISGSKWDMLCTPRTRLDDFHLCYKCMLDFVNFVGEGTANDR